MRRVSVRENRRRREKDLHQYDWDHATLKTSLDPCRQIAPVNDFCDELNGIIHPQPLFLHPPPALEPQPMLAKLIYFLPNGESEWGILVIQAKI